jgi:hypothetical protein
MTARKSKEVGGGNRRLRGKAGQLPRYPSAKSQDKKEK